MQPSVGLVGLPASLCLGALKRAKGPRESLQGALSEGPLAYEGFHGALSGGLPLGPQASSPQQISAGFFEGLAGLVSQQAVILSGLLGGPPT